MLKALIKSIENKPLNPWPLESLDPLLQLNWRRTLKNKKLMENFSAFLEENGFEVSGIQKVNYKSQDIRFFHDQDRKGAFLLKKHLTGFVQSVKNLNENKIKVINLSRKYPGAQNGLLEVWVDF
jgi:hypothetical protein